MNREELYRLFKKFQQGKMSAGEQADFQMKIDQDADMSAQFEEYKFFNEALIYNDLAEVKDQLETFDYGDPSTGGSWKKYLVSSVILMVGAGAYFTTQNGDKKVYESTLTTISEEVSEEKVIEEAVDVKPIHAVQKKHQEKSVTNVTPSVKEKIEGEDIEAQEEAEVLVLVSDEKLEESVVTDPEPNAKKESEKAPCDVKSWKLTEHIINECTGESNGSYSIAVENVDVPFVITLDGVEVDALRHDFAFLSAGIYGLKLRDVDGCELDKTITIKEHTCFDADVIIDPESGVFWTYPLSDDETYTVIIRNKTGQVVFEQEVFEGQEWEGVDNQGTQLPMAVYFYQFVGLPDLVGSVTVE